MLAGVEIVTLRAGALEADFSPGAGMVCASLRRDGQELLGQREGLEAYARTGSTFGIPLLYPWANRLSARRFECLGRTVDLDAAPQRFRDDGETGLPIHGARTAGGAWSVERADERSLVASLDWGADPELLAAFPFEHRAGDRARHRRRPPAGAVGGRLPDRGQPMRPCSADSRPIESKSILSP